jgi:iron complex transport system ATP-binding protein
MKIEVRDLDCGYQFRSVLNGLSFPVEVGEVVALVGPNGCGKTTLLRTISGLLAPQRGAVYLDCQRLHQLSPAEIASQLASIEQEIHCAFEISVREAVALGRLPHLRRWGQLSRTDQAAIDQAMQHTHIDPFADRPVQTLSSGERQRVWLAMALAQEPNVLLLDEPTSHLDIKYQIEIMHLVRTLAEQGIAILLSLHDLNLAAHYADRLVLLSEGRLLAVGRPVDVLTESLLEAAYRVRVKIWHNGHDSVIVMPPFAIREGV